MDSYRNQYTYSSQEPNYESYPYASNFEESQNQSFDQQYYEDELYSGNGQYYDDGGYYEDGMHSYNQQGMCNEGYDQWSEQPNYYREEQWYPSTSSYDGSQQQYDEDSYDQCYSSPQHNGEASSSRDKMDSMIEMMDEILALQKEISKNLEVIQAQQAEEMEYDQEVHESPEDQSLEVEESFDTLEGQALTDYMIRLCSAPLTDDELEPSLEGMPEGEHLEPGGFDLHEDVVEDEIHGYSQQIPYGGVDDQEEGPIDSYPRVYDCGLYGQEEGCHNAQWEEQSYSTHFENPLWESDESLHEELGEPLVDDIETPRGLVIHEDLFDNACEDLSREQPCTQEFMSEEEDDELRTPKCKIQIVEDWLSVEPWSSVEDPYLLTLPPSKFWSFRPYIDTPIEWNSYGPSLFKEVNLSRGPNSQNDVHCRLDGRKFKWDLKVD